MEVCANASKHVSTASKHVFNSLLKKFLVVWKYAQMHQNTVLTTLDGKIFIF
jgi:hypothetical protein